jgi:transcriptional antiterminator Rof (Rho-off)
MKDSYLPVSCDFYDELLAIATKKKKVKVYIFNRKGSLNEISGEI